MWQASKDIVKHSGSNNQEINIALCSFGLASY